MTPAQTAAIKADILANADLNVFPNTLDGAFGIAELYRLNASPAVTVWKTNETVDTVGKVIVATSLAALVTADSTRLGVIVALNPGGFNPSRPDQRTFFDDVFSAVAGAPTRTALLALWKRLALRIEKLMATGTGSDASPATLTWEGPIAYQDVYTARNS
jgi:hypothetical protein